MASGGLLAHAAFVQAAPEHATHEKSMHDASAIRARYEEVTNEESPDHLLLVILVFSFGLLADDADNSGLKGVIQSGFNLPDFVLSDQPRILVLRELLVLPGLVHLLNFDDPAHRMIDRDDPL